VKIAFSHRRKKLRNNLKALPLLDHDLKKVSLETGINFDMRGEMLSIKEYLKMSRSIGKIIERNNANN
jgi:16S rRNA A1518/A1519 N6-dimethyltransferase RsmA/KsgA/DIM1 with predicted DNA glycosylase/AP lyase activity